MRRSRPRSPAPMLALLTLAVALVAGCRDPQPTAALPAHTMEGHLLAAKVAPAAAAEPVTGEQARQIAQLRNLTASFHQFETARQAGWSAQITPCFQDPTLGGMGFHYGNPQLIDGSVDVLEPELLLYEPQKNGQMRLVAVEYIVPFDAWEGSEPPQLYGRSFARNEAFGIWALHVWHFKHNPSGMFADWNPDVNCDFAP